MLVSHDSCIFASVSSFRGLHYGAPLRITSALESSLECDVGIQSPSPKSPSDFSQVIPGKVETVHLQHEHSSPFNQTAILKLLTMKSGMDTEQLSRMLLCFQPSALLEELLPRLWSCLEKTSTFSTLPGELLQAGSQFPQVVWKHYLGPLLPVLFSRKAAATYGYLKCGQSEWRSAVMHMLCILHSKDLAPQNEKYFTSNFILLVAEMIIFSLSFSLSRQG